MKRPLITLLFTLVSIFPLAAQQGVANRKLDDQKKVVERLERQIAEGERELAGIKKDRSSAERRARRLARQIESRNDLLAQSEGRRRDLLVEVERADSAAGSSMPLCCGAGPDMRRWSARPTGTIGRTIT